MVDELSMVYGYLYSGFDPRSIVYQIAARAHFAQQVFHLGAWPKDKDLWKV